MAASSADTATGGSATIGATEYHAPEGYLICNGGDIPTSGTFQGVNATLLQNLRNFLGSTYGATGRLPNLINNFAGYSAVPGQTGGAATVTLTTAQMPSHNHTASTGGAGAHSHSQNFNYIVRGDAGGKETPGGGGRGIYQNQDINGVGDHTHSVSVGNAGSDQAHENLPPYVGMLPVIKY
jgi:microcystin-dependent protein